MFYGCRGRTALTNDCQQSIYKTWFNLPSCTRSLFSNGMVGKRSLHLVVKRQITQPQTLSSNYELLEHCDPSYHALTCWLMVFSHLKNKHGETPSVTGGFYYNNFCPWLLTQSFSARICPQPLRETEQIAGTQRSQHSWVMRLVLFPFHTTSI